MLPTSVYAIHFQNDREAPEVPWQPHVAISSWRVIETPDGDRHLLALLSGRTIRITTALTTINCVTRTATTASGRTYEFLAGPEESSVIRSAFEINAHCKGIQEFVDISDVFWAAIRAVEQ